MRKIADHPFLLWFTLFLCVCSNVSSAEKYPDLTPITLKERVHEMMSMHVSHKRFNEKIAKRSLKTFAELLDPFKIYWTLKEVESWIDPSPEMLEKVVKNYEENEFKVYEDIFNALGKAIARRSELEKKLSDEILPSKELKARDFRKLEWAQDTKDLQIRLQERHSFRLEALNKLEDVEKRELTLKRLHKRQQSKEDDYLEKDSKTRKRVLFSYIIKAIAQSLDSHTTYFTPAEATQFLIDVQRRLSGIGILLRDDLNGFSVVKVLEGGPAAKGGKLKAKDRIIAVDGDPVVGMDIIDAVQLMRGESGTEVILRVVREEKNATADEKVYKTLDIEVERGEVVLKESRYESSVEPFGDGVIARIKLFSFYRDPTDSSSEDIRLVLEKISSEHSLKGVILDLRSNPGGILSQAVQICGLFITKGIVVSIKDDRGTIRHLRDVSEGVTWGGPLIILINRASASASEIVAQTLQDYGRAILIGDDHTFGKGSFQVLTLAGDDADQVNPKGEFKVTRGKYYTVSGKTPQKVGVLADIIVPGVLSQAELGESFSDFPLENDRIAPNFSDDLSDLNWSQKIKFRQLYRFNLQQPIKEYQSHLQMLTQNSTLRIKENKNYQNFLKEIDKENLGEEDEQDFGQNDLQLRESYNIMKDLIYLLNNKKVEESIEAKAQ